jgi:hypothetical protein
VLASRSPPYYIENSKIPRIMLKTKFYTQNKWGTNCTFLNMLVTWWNFRFSKNMDWSISKYSCLLFTQLTFIFYFAKRELFQENLADSGQFNVTVILKFWTFSWVKFLMKFIGFVYFVIKKQRNRYQHLFQSLKVMQICRSIFLPKWVLYLLEYVIVDYKEKRIVKKDLNSY